MSSLVVKKESQESGVINEYASGIGAMGFSDVAEYSKGVYQAFCQSDVVLVLGAGAF